VTKAASPRDFASAKAFSILPPIPRSISATAIGSVDATESLLLLENVVTDVCRRCRSEFVVAEEAIGTDVCPKYRDAAAEEDVKAKVEWFEKSDNNQPVMNKRE
jgi:hypothetical protein